MVKNGILSIVIATLLICGFVPLVNAATFTLHSIAITDWNEASDGPGLDILTDNSAHIPYATSPNLLVGQSWTFNLFDIWTEESQVKVDPTEDDIERPITVNFDWSMPDATGGPITGITKGYVSGYGTVIYDLPFVGLTPIEDYLNDEGQVTWDSSADFTFGNGGIFNLTLSPTSFSQGIPSTVPGQGGQWTSLAGSLMNPSTVQATLLYAQAPTAVPLPPAIIMMGTGILGIAGIRRKSKK